MGAQTMASRPKRQQQIETDDAVLTRVLEFTEWVKRNVVLVGGVAGVLVLLLVPGGPESPGGQRRDRVPPGRAGGAVRR
jgi:hypothetical protein